MKILLLLPLIIFAWLACAGDSYDCLTSVENSFISTVDNKVEDFLAERDRYIQRLDEIFNVADKTGQLEQTDVVNLTEEFQKAVDEFSMLPQPPSWEIVDKERAGVHREWREKVLSSADAFKESARLLRKGAAFRDGSSWDTGLRVFEEGGRRLAQANIFRAAVFDSYC